MKIENETVDEIVREMIECHSPTVFSEDVRNFGYRISDALSREREEKRESSK